MMKKILFLIFIILFIFGCERTSSISKSEKLKEALQNLIQKEIKPKVVGVQLSILHPDYGEISVAAGKANIAENLPLSTDQNLRIASATKIFTAILVMKLVEEEQLSLDNTMGQLLPDLPFATANKITVKNLLQHTSGFKGYFNDDTTFQNTILENPSAIYLPDSLVKKALKLHIPKESEIGTEFHYNNTNFVILGMIIEKKFGKPYADCIKEYITDIINLNHTFAKNSLDGVENMTEGYVFFDQDPVLGNKFNHSFLFSAGNLISKTSDLVKLIDALMKNKILKKETMKEMTTYIDTKDDAKEGLKYGLGIGKFENLGVGHNGLTLGYTSIMVYNEDYDFSIAVLINSLSSEASPEEIARKVLEELIKNY